MGKIDLSKQVNTAAKWSSITEISAKIINPIISMILARILVPEAFGVVATVSMIISFADMFTDAGFQKYLVQHEFKNNDEKHKSTTVAFWTNLGVSLFLWGVIAINSEQIATLVGNPGLGNVIAVASLQLPLTSFSSIQMALYRRDFDFRTLFLVRIISICVPFVVTIPLALFGLSYWSIIIGTVCGNLSNAIILTIKSKWKPSWYYNYSILKKMLSFSIWSLIESVSIWLTTWVDAFIIGIALNEYFLGLYKTSTTMVNGLMALVTAAIVPVLFSALSRLQNDEVAFKELFYRVQRYVAYLVLPMGVGVYLYSDIATQILLGRQWSEASDIIGIWALTSSIMIVFSHFNSEVYRSMGRPKLSFLSQILHLVFLVPVCMISLDYGFWILVYARSLIRLQSVLVGFFIMQLAMGFSAITTIKNNLVPIYCTLIMCTIVLLLQQISNSLMWSILSIALSTLFYVSTVLVFGNDDVKRIKTFIKKS